MNSLTDYPKSILITSAIPSEGKSLISANLAYSCANHGRKTILIDFDLRRPGLHKFCDLENKKGLVTLINEASSSPETIDSSIKSTAHEIHPNLYILPSGGKTRAATEMLEQKEFDIVLAALRREFDVIIVDSPPIGLFPDSLAIARKVDEVLFVTRYGKVSRKVAKNLSGKPRGYWSECIGSSFKRFTPEEDSGLLLFWLLWVRILPLQVLQ